MISKYYRATNSDLNRVSQHVEQWFSSQEYETQVHRSDDVWMIQARKTGFFRAAVSACRAFTVTIQGNSNEFVVTTGTGEWAKNITTTAVTSLLTGGLTLIGTGIAAAWTKKVEADLVAFIDREALVGPKVSSTTGHSRS